MMFSTSFNGSLNYLININEKCFLRRNSMSQRKSIWRICIDSLRRKSIRNRSNINIEEIVSLFSSHLNYSQWIEKKTSSWNGLFLFSFSSSLLHRKKHWFSFVLISIVFFFFVIVRDVSVIFLVNIFTNVKWIDCSSSFSIDSIISLSSSIIELVFSFLLIIDVIGFDWNKNIRSESEVKELNPKAFEVSSDHR